MNRLSFFLPIFGLVVFQVKPAFGQDVNDRFAECQLEMDWANEGMSFLVDRIHLADYIRYGGNPDDATDETPRKVVVTNRTLQRVVISDRGKRKRIDSTQYALMDVTDVFADHRESQLIHEKEGWYFFRKSGHPEPVVIRFELKGGVPALYTRTKWKNPFLVSATVASSILDDSASSLLNKEFVTIEEEKISDGRTRFLTFTKQGGVHKTTFAKEPSWMVEEIEFFKRKLDVQRANPAIPSVVTKKDLENYEWYGKTSTKWKEVANGRYVPWQTIMSQQGRQSDDQYEFRFRDWKFGKDVDKSLLDVESFTEEKIDKSIDFFKVRERFDLEVSK